MPVSRSPRFALLLLLAALCALIAPSAALAAPSVLSISGGISDNYKARYNADPSQPERRTWLSMDAIVADGVTWAPAAPGTDHATSSALTLNGSDGRTATLTLGVQRGSLGLTVLRTDRPSATVDHVRWGVLTTINDPDALAAQSALVQLTMTVGGATLATGIVEYRHEPAFDGLTPSHIEYNGPRGRWYIGGTPLRTDWEPAAPVTAPPAINPSAKPRIVKLTMPARTSNRRVPIKVSGRGVGPKITSIRFRVGAARWSKWQRVAASYRLTLPARNARWTVGVQLRDANGAMSAVVSRGVRCSCG
ncbi:MAG: hypothetical protein JWN72_2474 [Thermoleophilia bacterium]|nr:hypothetical protein [Thermoleophilia bacterium]